VGVEERRLKPAAARIGCPAEQQEGRNHTIESAGGAPAKKIFSRRKEMEVL